MSEHKTALLTVKLSPVRLEEFRIASMLRGVTMSALVSQFIAQVVREEMIAVPAAFQRRRAFSDQMEINNDDLDLSTRTN